MPRRSSVLTLEIPRSDFTVLYDDSKNYWKARATLDILIANHTKFNCVEVAVYNPELDKEAPRIYLDLKAIEKHLDYPDLERRVAEKKESFLRMKKPCNSADIVREVHDSMVVTYIMNRLQVERSPSANPTAAAPGSDPAAEPPADDFSMVISPLTGDIVVNEALRRLDSLMDKPLGVTPIQCSFQKKLRAEAIELAMNSFKNEADALRRATHLAEITSASADGFRTALAERMRLQRKMSLPRQRWVRAVHRVVIQNHVAMVRRRLEDIEERKRLAEEEAAELANPSKKSTRSRILRKSIDNSSLPVVKPTQGPGLRSSNHMSMKSTSMDAAETGSSKRMPGLNLPSIQTSHSEVSLAAPTKGAGVRRSMGAILERSTFHEGDEGGSRKRTAASHKASPTARSMMLPPAMRSNDSAPSLIQSYANVSNRVAAPIPTHALMTVQQVSSRSLRQLKN